MVLKRISIINLFFILVFGFSSTAQVSQLKKWLETPTNQRETLKDLRFAKRGLTKKQVVKATALILADKQANMLSKYGMQWEDRVFVIDSLKMPFYYQIFGDKPADGRSLFISLHGGGNAPAIVNDRQYENQKHLYDRAIKSMECVYMALRAPTNTWNLWYEDHIDDFLNAIIQMAVIKEDVNPNKVYILGYSAGGDGLYQLAPRMADRWAAASMMAGHPGDASALSMRNMPFSIHMGGLDAAYNRNGLAEKWSVMLDSLHQKDPKGFIHDVQVHKEMGHWMKLKDAVALPWMKKYTRNPIPEKVIWKQDNRLHNSFYWIGTPKDEIKEYGEIIATYNKHLNEMNILENYSDNIQLYINDDMLDLDAPLTIKHKGKVIYNDRVDRTILNIYVTLLSKGDDNLVFPSMLSVINNIEVEQ